MSAPANGFDLALGYGQWQGSGRPDNLARGAAAAAAICGRFAPLETVPLSEATELAHGVNRWAALLDQFASAQAILARHHPRRLLTAGGDCAVDVAPIDYLHNLYPNLTVVWIDAHPDANTPETSPSGNFHGMPVSAIMGRAPEPMRRRMGAPLDPSRFFYAGVGEGDEGDRIFRQEQRLGTLARDAVLAGPVHIHFDLDVLDPAQFPHLAYTDGQLSIDEAVALVSRIARETELVGLTITEFAPADDAAAREGGLTIERICEAALRQ